MSHPKLENWTSTAHGLHQGVLLLGMLQRLSQAPQPAYLELGLKVMASGLSCGALPMGGRVALDMGAGSLVYSPMSGEKYAFPLAGRSQADVFEDLFQRLARAELSMAISNEAGADLFERVSRAIAGKNGRYSLPRRELFMDEAVIQIDAQTAKNYLEVLQQVFTGIARFQAQHVELKTPLLVWPEHFDLSSLMFMGNEIDDYQPHINVGFAPFSHEIEYPYLYAYGYPYPENYKPAALPGGASWHTQDWMGVVVPYDQIALEADPAGFVEASCEAIFAGLRPFIWGRSNPARMRP